MTSLNGPQEGETMRQAKSCGVLVFRREPELSFLLMRHPDRFDLPKGHVRKGESEVECACRELAEETGLTSDDIRLEEGFRFVTTYHARYKRFGDEMVEKQVVIFLGWLEQSREIVVSEHQGHEWFRWQPPHQIETKTVDAVLATVQQFFEDAE
jgi:8-oxo-dGTP pyrophosphatase MutT (NUDIX family)